MGERRQSQDEESGVGDDTDDDDGEGRQEKGRINRSLSTAPTIVNDDSRYASPSPQPAEASNSSNNNNNTRPHGIPRGSTLWSATCNTYSAPSYTASMIRVLVKSIFTIITTAGEKDEGETTMSRVRSELLVKQ